MFCPSKLNFSRLAAQAYADGYAAHGEIDLQLERFENRLHIVIERHLGRNASEAAISAFFCTLHATDLYLTEACVQPSEAAWRRFETAYRKFINNLAGFISSSRDAGREVAADVMAGLFMPDSSGQSGIASFDGRQSLATWLGVIVTRRAINRKALKWNSFESLENTKELADNTSVARIGASIRRGRYESIVEDCLREAFGSLTDRERLIVLLRYEQGLRLVEIAKAMSLHPSRVTRGLQNAHLKLQEKIVFVLSAKYKLGSTAIDECVAEMLENPAHSPLILLKESQISRKANAVSARS